MTIFDYYVPQGWMKNRGTEDGLIASEDLSPTDVPSDDAPREVLETFCLTFDGYQGERYSFADLFRRADLIERRGLKNATLDELRSAAFILQRNLHGTSQGDDVADAPTVTRIRRLVAEIGRRVADEGNHSTD